MKRKPKNEQIGTCPCPHVGCTKAMKLFKFQARDNALQRRFAGKLYGDCEDHGRYGADGKDAAQNYILDNEATELWDEKERAARAERPRVKSDGSPAMPPAQPTPAPAASPPASKAPAPRRHLWDM
jgi:hypothetical protein